MKRIIEIDEKDYNLVYDLISGVEPEFCRDRVYKAIVNGTPVAEGDWVMFSLLMTTIADKGLPFEEVLLLIDNAKTPTKDDCINREALKKKIRKYTEPSSKLSDDFSIGMTECACEILDMIDNAPTVPQPNEQIAWEQGYEAGLAQGKHDRPKGEWIPMNPDCRGYSDYFKCSICGAYIYPNIPEKELDYNGCPYCFADMRGGAE